MKIEKKVELLNKFVNGSLSIAYYTEWSLRSYKEKSFFSYGDGSNDRNIWGEKFSEVVEVAYKKMQKEKKRRRKLLKIGAFIQPQKEIK